MDKDYILAEIRRTARANGGVALGRERFEKETGIRRADWLGRFWARWGDALQDAGFSANQLQLAYEDDFVLEGLARLTRDLGRLPVEAELRIQARNDTRFPSHTTFSRFGNTQARAHRLMEFCRAHGGFDDVIRICKSVEAAAPKELAAKDTIGVEIGFVYLMKSGRYYKIGHTNAIGRRERELAIQLPERVRVVHTIKTDDPPGIEDYWHRRFNARRKNGEWFDLTSEDIAAFKRRKVM